ncbi:phasin family protein [Denitromonas halophila]|uniref:Phasin family protein n=1 Tax=Denitromonas halophila TaxID=1629404 RepID=A0A557QQV2_9RHOO|nr:phasin family protein [Denitromonas halophila]TVO55290.1 phasin family protein [Denitromonas halophila]
MAIKPEQLNALQKKNLEAAMRLAQMSIENSQRIMELQVRTAKTLFEDGVNNAKAMTTTQDPQDMLRLRTEYAQASTERMLACAREIAEVAAQAQTEVGKMVSEQLATGGNDVFEAINKMFTGMPITDQNAMGAVQGAMDNARAAFEQMTRASTEAFQAFTQVGAAAQQPAKRAPARRK